ncbi:MAG: LacI family transcriptional regulator [Fimbriimonadaceae bacterium]|jgi:DNA-binding LacI/PurR family transcriptional regulator|nr:LacI family transcriptional regulator [Fimbriimonadaceae bacterium]
MPATIRDIAKKLNISVSTVSYALNNGPRPVPDHVKKKVFDVAKELDYRPNRIARSLITRRSRTIGFVLEKPEHNIFLGPYVQLIVNGVINACEDHRHDLLLFAQHGAVSQEEFVNQLLDGRADGLVFTCGESLLPIIEEVHQRGIPFVVVGAGAPPYSHSFQADNDLGIEQAIDHLADLGHTKIGFVRGNATHGDAIHRLSAFRRTMSERGLAVHSDWVWEGNFTVESGESALASYLSLPEKPTAIIAANDEMAIGVLRKARAEGIEIPQRLSVVGFDDSPHTQGLYPGLTTIHQPVSEIGSAAAHGLFQLIDERPTDQPSFFPTRLVVRASTAAPTKEPNNHEIK